MSGTNVPIRIVVAILAGLCLCSQMAMAERNVLKRFALYDMHTAEDVSSFRALKKQQTVVESVLPARVGVRVEIKTRGAFKYILKVNGEKVRRLRGRKQIAQARRGLSLSAEWNAQLGQNVFTATGVYRQQGSRYRQRKVKRVRVVEDSNKDKDPTEPTPEPTVEPTVNPTTQPTANPTVEPTVNPTAEPTVEPTVEPTPEDPDPTPTPTPVPTAAPQPYECGAGVNKVLARPASSVTLSGYCTMSGISSITWQQVSGPATASFSNIGALTPVVSNLTGAGVYTFQITVQHNQGTTVDTMQVGVSNQVSGFGLNAAVRGPQNVVRGFPLYLDLEMSQSGGGHDYAYVAVAGLPHGIDYSMPDWAANCCDGGKRGWSPYDTLMHFTVASDVPVGTYPITIQVSSGGVIRNVPHTIMVNAVPEELTAYPVASNPSIPRLAQWEHNMTHFGNMWCDAGQISMWEGSVWYYDGMRIYYQLSDYTGNSSWADTCVPIVRDIYRNFVLDAGGAIQGWRVFPHGLQMDYQRKGQNSSRTAAQQMALNSAFAGSGGGVPVEESRETAYLIHAFSIAEELGAAEHQHLQRAVAFALGHLDQVAITRSEPKVKPFMIALTFEALIRYYEKTGDPRIPAVLKQSADFLWEEAGAWDEDSQSFLYISQNFAGEDPADPAPDLNLLIAPLFGWLYHKTGEVKYQLWGDKVFAGGVTEDFDGDTFYEGGACLGCTGKIFSQNYRWSIDYVQWRQSPPQ